MNEENGSGTLTNMFIGHLAEVPGSNPSAGSYRYYATDLIRSTRALFNQSKTQVAHYEYTPYGELYGSSGSVSTTRRYTGHQWDAASKLYFAPYRYYRPDLARWLSPDPAGFVDGLNVYGYVQGNPVMYYDPLGHMRDDCNWRGGDSEKCCDQRYHECMLFCATIPDSKVRRDCEDKCHVARICCQQVTSLRTQRRREGGMYGEVAWLCCHEWSLKGLERIFGDRVKFDPKDPHDCTCKITTYLEGLN